MSHDLGLRFLSPTINLSINEHKEFLIFCRHLDYYLTLPLSFIPSQWNYPVGVLQGEYGDVKIYFIHYHTEEEARAKWEERKKRVRNNNLYVVMDGDNCTDQQLQEFDKLPQEKKVVLAMSEHPEIKSVWTIKHPDYPQGKILEYGLLFKSVRWYEMFDYVHFFNTGEIRDNALFCHKKKNQKTA